MRTNNTGQRDIIYKLERYNHNNIQLDEITTNKKIIRRKEMKKKELSGNKK